MADKKYGCPVCGYSSDNEEDAQNHLVEMADDPKHQEYEMKQEAEEDARINEEI